MSRIPHLRSIRSDETVDVMVEIQVHTSYLSQVPQVVPVEKNWAMWRSFRKNAKIVHFSGKIVHFAAKVGAFHVEKT